MIKCHWCEEEIRLSNDKQVELRLPHKKLSFCNEQHMADFVKFNYFDVREMLSRIEPSPRAQELLRLMGIEYNSNKGEDSEQTTE